MLVFIVDVALGWENKDYKVDELTWDKKMSLYLKMGVAESCVSGSNLIIFSLAHSCTHIRSLQSCISLHQTNTSTGEK